MVCVCCVVRNFSDVFLNIFVIIVIVGLMYDIVKCYLFLFNLIKKIIINWWCLKLFVEIFVDNFWFVCFGKIYVVINVKFYVVIGLLNWFFVRFDVESGYNVV